MKKKFKISSARYGHCFGRYRADDAVGAVHKLMDKTGYADYEYAIEVVQRRPCTETELIVSGTGVVPSFIIVRDLNASCGCQDCRKGQVVQVTDQPQFRTSEVC